MKQILVCKTCEAQLSNPLIVVEEGDSDYPDLNWEDEKPLGEKGIVLLRHEPYASNFFNHGTMNALDFVPCYLIRLDDIKSCVGLTDKSERLNGCCGLDGCNGPNRICVCSSFVGTEQSDCWTPRVFIPDIENTKWLNVKS